MKKNHRWRMDGASRPGLFAAIAAVLVPLPSFGQGAEEVVGEPAPRESALETKMDLPGDFHRYFGQETNRWRDSERKIAKLDLDADLNYDGTVDNGDPRDGGAFEQTPPGLMVGVGEMSKFIVRLYPYRVDFRGSVVVGLEVDGINRANRSGRFASFEDEIRSVGHIRVWADEARTRLLLDSRNPEKRYFEWVFNDSLYYTNLPRTVPRMVFVEGVSPSGRFPGDIRLLITVSHRGAKERSRPPVDPVAKGELVAPAEPVEKGGLEEVERRRILRPFKSSFDHILVTVRPEPLEKEFVNRNAEGVWIDLRKEIIK